MSLDKFTCVYKWDPSVYRISAGFIYYVSLSVCFFFSHYFCMHPNVKFQFSSISCFFFKPEGSPFYEHLMFSPSLWASNQNKFHMVSLLFFFSLTILLVPRSCIMPGWQTDVHICPCSLSICWGTSEMISSCWGESCSPRDGCAVFFSFHSQRRNAGRFSVRVHVQIIPINASAHAWTPKQAAHVRLSHVTSRSRHSQELRHSARSMWMRRHARSDRVARYNAAWNRRRRTAGAYPRGVLNLQQKGNRRRLC